MEIHFHLGGLLNRLAIEFRWPERPLPDSFKCSVPEGGLSCEQPGVMRLAILANCKLNRNLSAEPAHFGNGRIDGRNRLKDLHWFQVGLPQRSRGRCIYWNRQS